MKRIEPFDLEELSDIEDFCPRAFEFERGDKLEISHDAVNGQRLITMHTDSNSFDMRISEAIQLIDELLDMIAEARDGKPKCNNGQEEYFCD